MGSNCNFHSGYWGSGNGGCSTPGFRSNAWCADFAHYVWATAGVSTLSGINSWAYSFAKYSNAYSTLHLPGSLDLSNIGHLPDGTLEDIDHVGIVESFSSGTVHTIEGNASDQSKRNSYPYSSSNIRGYITASGLIASANLAAQPVAPVHIVVGVDRSGRQHHRYPQRGLQPRQPQHRGIRQRSRNRLGKYRNTTTGWSTWIGLGGTNTTGTPTALYHPTNDNTEGY